MQFSAYEWTLLIAGALGAIYCFTPYGGYCWQRIKERWISYQDRREMRRLIRDYAKRKPYQMSTSWKRMKAYEKDGDTSQVA